MVSLLIIIFLGICSFGSLAGAISPRSQTFRSYNKRPDLLVPKLTSRVAFPDLIEPGYIFFSSWGGTGAQEAPYIYDSDLNLVWSGRDHAFTQLGYFNLQAHDLANGTHIMSVFRGVSIKGRGRGSIILLDSSYNVVREFTSGDPTVALDYHEVSIRNDAKTAIVTLFPARRFDLSYFNIDEGFGWVLDSVFREISLDTGEILFEWRATDHIPISETTISPNIKKGGGLSSHYPFDYCHINSVDKFANGDYLISSRHMNTIYRISHADGHIVWRLGGDQSSFMLENYEFAAQHDARVVAESADVNEFELTFVYNADNGQYQTRDFTSALHVVVTNHSGIPTSRLIHEWTPLDGGLAQHQGTVQHRLPSTQNTLISWGQVAEFSEFTPQGKRVLDVEFNDDILHVYRVMKASWIGRPDSLPDLHMYARSESDMTQFFMSWNGATEVRAWRCYGLEEGVAVPLGQTKKNGFESHFESTRFVGSGYIEALDGKGEVLARSKTVDVTIPPPHLAGACDIHDCSLQISTVDTSAEAGCTPLVQSAPRDSVSELPVDRNSPHMLQSGLPLMIGWALGRFGCLSWMTSCRHKRFLSRGRVLS